MQQTCRGGKFAEMVLGVPQDVERHLHARRILDPGGIFLHPVGEPCLEACGNPVQPFEGLLPSRQMLEDLSSRPGDNGWS